MTQDPVIETTHEQRVVQFPELSGELYKEMRPRLRAFLRGRGLTSGMIDDVIHDAFLAVASGRVSHLERPDKVFPFLAGITQNVLRSHLRQDRRQVPAGRPQDLEPVGPAVHDEVNDVIERFAIDQMIVDLPQDVRQAAQLLMDGFEIREISGLLGLHPNVVRRLLEDFRMAVRDATGSMDPAASADKAILADIERNFGASLRTPQPTAPPRSAPERVARAVSVLPKRQREVVSRHLYGQLKPRHIAAELNISPNTARVNLYHAYTALSTHLGLTKDAIQSIARSELSPTEPTAA